MSTLDYQYIAKLVVMAQTGDSDAFAELYAATYQRQYRFAYNYLKDEYLAQDALQETYILVLKNLSTLRDPKLFVSWLNQISFRVCFGMHKKQSKFNSEMSEYSMDIMDRQDNSFDTPEKQVVIIDEKEYIIRQIMNLPFSESQAIILRYYHNMKLDEIADLMDASKSSVKRYLASGRERLKKLLEQ